MQHYQQMRRFGLRAYLLRREGGGWSTYYGKDETDSCCLVFIVPSNYQGLLTEHGLNR